MRGALDAAASRLGIRNARGLPIRFTAPDAAGDAAYEEHIYRTGEVPTRDNLHDFFNALVWLTFPRAKARLNALQAGAIAQDGVGPRRGPLRDAATLIDENAVLLVTPRDDLVDALAAHDWRSLFVVHRTAWRSEVRAIVFGHALMEKLTAPYRGATAHALPLRAAADTPLAGLDEAVAAVLDGDLTPGRLLPLPVLGIPGWAENEDATFYDDASVFRPARGARSARGAQTRLPGRNP
ncbi:MAG TPA: DUF3025 domain-containing protein [Burkholderiaceae bacterium]|nr:DUF3025 domain-containing protein [Burkholderiaceae bacterium]